MRGDNYIPNYTEGYTSWAAMKTRCDNPNRSNWPKYGGAGLSYQLSWEKFENFIADMGERPKNTSLDRIDNTKGYSKENCRWADAKVQATNRRNTVYVTNPHTGKTYTIAELAVILGINHKMAYKAYIRGNLIFKQTAR